MNFDHLTIPQQNIWNLQKYYTDTAISNISGILLFEGELDIARLAKAVNRYIELNEGMRLQFAEQDGEDCQYIVPYEEIEIPVLRFDSLEEARESLAREGRVPFGMTDSSMYRVKLIEVPGQCGIWLCFNHMIADAWAASLFCKKVMEYYAAPGQGAAIGTDVPGYREYIAHEREYLQSERFRQDGEYWDGCFAQIPAISKIKPETVPSADARAFRRAFRMEREFSDRLLRFCEGHRISPAVLFEAAVCLYLHKTNGKRDKVYIGSMVYNRMDKRSKQTAGMFVSTMPLGVALEDADTVDSLLDKIMLAHRELFRHQNYPYERILKAVREKYDVQGNLYDVLVSYQNASVAGDFGDLKYRTEWFSNGYSEVPLAVHVDDRDKEGCLNVTLDCQTEVFAPEEVELLYRRFAHILEQITEEGGCGTAVGDISIMPQAEYDKVIFGFNQTAVDYPKDCCVHELFREQAARTPNSIALVFEDKEFSYRQLDEMSNSLAHELRNRGVKPNDIVPIIARRSWHVIVAMLGILKAGGAYMPVDPDYPMDRITYMLSETDCKITLIYRYKGEIGIPVIDLAKVNYRKNVGRIEVVNSSKDSCYIIFTSGSTGRPKASVIAHKNLVNFCDNNNNNQYQSNMVNNCKCVLAYTTFTFDISVFEIYLSLLNGLKIVLANEEECLFPPKLVSLIASNNVDVIHSTPTRLLSIIENSDTEKIKSCLKVIMVGAEVFTKEFYRKLKFFEKAVIYNGYGPTECTIGVTFCRINHINMNEDTNPDITIGKPIANTQIYILDASLNPMPVGVAGELCISGEGVGKGYLNRPELTAEKFIPNPFATEANGHGKTMYRTGDLARWRADGELEYLGRIDTQVKIRGLRIELGEIEGVMGTFPGISLCAVADKRDADGRQYLAGYYTAEPPVDERALRGHLAGKLPSYMVPNYFVHMESLPMTASGKLDRKRLPEPELKQEKRYMPPQNDTERMLAELYGELLKQGKVGRDDDFLLLGGDSLTAITLLAKIEDVFHVRLDMRELMGHTAVSALAERIGSAQRLEHAILHEEGRSYPLMPQQKAIWLACEKNPDSCVYNMPMFVRLREGTDTGRLKKKLTDCYLRHPSLRTCIRMEGDGIAGTVMDASAAPLVFGTFERKEEFVRPFDLSRAPLVRVGFGEGGMAVDIHHIVCDGESINRMLEEVLEEEGRQQDTAREAVDYRDYALDFYRRLQDGSFDAHKAFFRELLMGKTERLPLPERTGKTETGAKTVEHPLDAGLTGYADGYARKERVGETCVYFALFGVLLSAVCGQERVATSIVLSNRANPALYGTVGMFVNTIPYVCAVEREGSFDAYIRRVSEDIFGLYRYQELPMFEICRAAEIADMGVFNTTFVYQTGEARIPGLDMEYIDTRSSKMDLSFQVVRKRGGSACVRIEYDAGKLDGGFVRYLCEAYEHLLCMMQKSDRMEEFWPLTAREYDKVVGRFNSHFADYDRTICAHQLFGRQAKAHSGKVALLSGGREFTYQELDGMSDSLAHFLRQRGVGRGDIVPIIARRGWQAVAAMLGIWKAGGAFMPVDPDYPAERVLYMLEEAGSRLALTFGYGEELPVDVLPLEEFDFTRDKGPVENRNSPGDTCYVIFTSGSTGKPKGVKLRHQGLVNFVISDSNSNIFHLTVFRDCTRTAAIGAFTFDISIVEIFQPLLNGLSVAVADDGTVNSAAKLAAYIKEKGVDFFHTTPTRLAYFMETQEFVRVMGQLKVVLVAGEALPEELYRRIRQCTGAKLFNGYGPTETTVGASFARLDGQGAVTIGKPIANTQIYILNEKGRPCPAGVAGELYISGDGVGEGYLNRPELTAERFLENPFATEANGHGKRMYRTGDLARWREDGELEYLGRIDTQVKIRGLRIELEEIENVMLGYPGIAMTAAAAGKDGKGRQYLAAYYTSADGVDEQGLRSYLCRKLPRYMVPNYFMRLDAIPVSVSGKTDRKSLPEPQIHRQEEYEPPADGLEETLCALMGGELGLSRMSAQGDFFVLGADSLKAVSFAAKAYDMGIQFRLQAVFDNPTPRLLAGYIREHGKAGIPSDADGTASGAGIRTKDGEAGKDGASCGGHGGGTAAERGGIVDGPAEKCGKDAADSGEFRDFLQENGRRFDALLAKEALPVTGGGIGTVLLTGATGFLGSHILKSLLAAGAKRIYCVVRGGTEGGGERLKRTLDGYFGGNYCARMGGAVIPLEGDLDDDALYGQLPPVDVVVHAAALVKHYGEYDRFHRANVIPTGKLLEYAQRVDAHFCQISTASIAGTHLVREGGGSVIFSERDFAVGQALDNVYIKSKYEAERLVLAAGAKGGRVSVMRVGNLTNRFRDGKFQTNAGENAFLKRMVSLAGLRAYPVPAMETLEFSPVDQTAEAVAAVVGHLQDTGLPWVYHIYHDRPVPFGAFSAALGRSMRAMAVPEFVELVKGRQGFHGMLKAELLEAPAASGHPGVAVENGDTAELLKRFGFCWKEIDAGYLKRYARYLESVADAKM